jgi:cobalamin biosynthesis Co2+ chelatase CbiK
LDKRLLILRIKKLGASLSPLGLKDFFIFKVTLDTLGDGPESWKSRLLAQDRYRVAGWRQGLGYNDDIIKIYLEHLQEALRTLTD